ncbi:MAG TPA: hypothetical protein VFC85_01305, partial [Verrucomicrobiae bacterium]|nr:hypothetical protein [Verrucomicrobiae bacterium]
FKCPQCNRPIMNRRNKNCLYCGAVLPENLLFSKEELAVQNRKFEQENQLARQKSQTDISWFNRAR